MNDLKIAMAVVAICTPAVSSLAAFVFYTVRYTRLRLARKTTLVDYLHDFAGSWTRLVMRADPPEEQCYLRRMLLAGAIFAAYVLIVMLVVGSY
jgi:hypothetical protein